MGDDEPEPSAASQAEIAGSGDGENLLRVQNSENQLYFDTSAVKPKLF